MHNTIKRSVGHFLVACSVRSGHRVWSRLTDSCCSQSVATHL